MLKNLNIRTKTNRNVINSIEFQGLFFKCYSKYLQKFFDYFSISKTEKNIIKRVDYCIDLKGIEVFELLEYMKSVYRKSKNVNALTGTDLKKLKQNNTNIKYGRQETFVNIFGNVNDLKIYDKILDILDKYTKRKINGKNPYQDYLDSDFPITRIELKKKRFTKMSNNSIGRIFENIEALFFDNLLKIFDINLSFYLGADISLNGKKIFLAKEEKSKKLFHSLTMALAYLKNIENLAGKKELYKFLLKNFPELEKINFTDLIDDIDLSDYFTGISDDII